MKAARLLALAGLSTLALASPAAAAQYGGSATDTPNDGPSQARDLVKVDATYDATAGSISVTATLGATAAAADRAFLFVALGKLNGSACGPPFIALGGFNDVGPGSVTTSAREDNKQAPLTASWATSGAAVTLSAVDSSLGGQAPDCLTANLSDGGKPATYYDKLDTPGTVVVTQADPPPPTTTPTQTTPPPATTPTQTTPPPATTPTTPPPAPRPVPKAAKLALSVSGIPKTIRRDKSLPLTLTVQNAGNATAKNVKLRVGQAKGLSATPRTRTLKELKGGQTRKLKLKVRLTKKAKTSTKLIALAESGAKLSARGVAVLKVGTTKPPKKATGGGGGPGSDAKNPLVGTYWWRTENHVDRAFDNRGLYFVDDKWVYRGFPKGGLGTVKCTAATAQGEDSDDEKSFGCLPYSYDAKTGAVAVGSTPGTYVSGALTVEGKTFEPLALAKPGSTFDLSLIHRSFNGLCGAFSTCTTSLSTFELKPDSSFVLTDSSTTTSDTGGTFVGGSGGPPDKRGLYQVQANGTIYFAYADGHNETRTFAVIANDQGQPDPKGGGLMLEQDNYYTEPD